MFNDDYYEEEYYQESYEEGYAQDEYNFEYDQCRSYLDKEVKMFLNIYEERYNYEQNTFNYVYDTYSKWLMDCRYISDGFVLHHVFGAIFNNSSLKQRIKQNLTSDLFLSAYKYFRTNNEIENYLDFLAEESTKAVIQYMSHIGSYRTVINILMEWFLEYENIYKRLNKSKDHHQIMLERDYEGEADLAATEERLFWDSVSEGELDINAYDQIDFRKSYLSSDDDSNYTDEEMFFEKVKRHKEVIMFYLRQLLYDNNIQFTEKLCYLRTIKNIVEHDYEIHNCIKDELHKIQCFIRVNDYLLSLEDMLKTYNLTYELNEHNFELLLKDQGTNETVCTVDCYYPIEKYLIGQNGFEPVGYDLRIFNIKFISAEEAIYDENILEINKFVLKRLWNIELPEKLWVDAKVFLTESLSKIKFGTWNLSVIGDLSYDFFDIGLRVDFPYSESMREFLENKTDIGIRIKAKKPFSKSY